MKYNFLSCSFIDINHPKFVIYVCYDCEYVVTIVNNTIVIIVFSMHSI